MKKLAFILIAIVAFSCSESDMNEDCACVETIYESEYIGETVGGSPVYSEYKEVSSKPVNCQPEKDNEIVNGRGKQRTVVECSY